MNTSPMRVVMKAFTAALRADGLRKPEADQQVRAQAHDFPTHEEREQVIRDNQRVHAEGEQTDKRKEARVHRLDRKHGMFVTEFIGHGCAMRRQTRVIVIASGLTKVMIANAVDEDHQHCPRHEEQNRGRERIDQHADLQPGLASRQPGD